MSNPYFSLLSIAWDYARKDRKKYVVIYVLFLLTNVVIAFNPVVYGWFIDSLQKDGTEALRYAWYYVALFLGLRLLEWMMHGPARIMERQLAFQLSKNFIDELYYNVLHLPLKWHKDHHTGSTINRVRKAYESLREFFQNGFVYVGSIGKFVFSFTAMVYFSPLYGSIAVLLGVVTVWVIVKFDKPIVASLREFNEREHTVSATLFDSLSNIITVITLRLEKRMHIQILGKIKRVFPAFRSYVIVNEWKWFTAQMMVGIIYCVILMGYMYQHWKPNEPFLIGGLVTLLVYVNQFTSVFNDIALQYSKIVQYDTDMQSALQLNKAYAESDYRLPTHPMKEGWKKLEVKNLQFSHSLQSATGKYYGSLQNVNINLQIGKKVALIGSSGSGKSTLLAVLRGLYAPGRDTALLVDSQPIQYFETLHNSVTLFPQEPEIFENTILYNITLGLSFTDEEVLEACTVSGFMDVVEQLPQGLHTSIQEKGVNLSGGQKQRLALARGILSAQSSSIVLLDEPTSSVDPKTELLVYQKMFALFTDKAVVSSLHRLHLLTLFDYVYIMHHGQVIDEGTFDDLLARSQPFQQLWQHQQREQTHAI